MIRMLYRLGVVGVVSAVCILCFAFWIASRAPGCAKVIDERDIVPFVPTPPQPPKPTSPLDAFRYEWNSEDLFTWEVAERLAEMSSAVYSDDDAAREAYRQLGFADSTAIQSGSMVAHVVHGEDVTVVVFRGTDDLEDWRTNLSQLRSSSPNGTVQGGFWLAYNAIKPQVRQHVFATPRKYLWITGHSLGGALALLCAYDLVAHGDSEPTGIMTFGQPMVAGRELASYLDGRFRGRYALFVNETDIVPRMLPAYTHCGSLVWFTGGKIMRSPRRVYSAGPEDFSKASPPTVNEVLPRASQADVESLRREVEVTQEGETIDGKQVVRGNLPFVEHHGMWLYLDKVRAGLNKSFGEQAPE